MKDKIQGIITKICKTIKLIDLDEGLEQIENTVYIRNINNIINYCCSLFSNEDNTLYNLIRCDNLVYIKNFLNDIDSNNKIDIIQIFFNKNNEIPDKYNCLNHTTGNSDESIEPIEEEDLEPKEDIVNELVESKEDEELTEKDLEPKEEEELTEEDLEPKEDSVKDSVESKEVIGEPSKLNINGGAKDSLNTITNEVADNLPIDKDDDDKKDEDDTTENELLNPDKLINDSIQNLNPSKLASDSIQNMIGMETDEEESKDVILKLFKEVFDDKIKNVVLTESEIHDRIQQFIITLYTRAGKFTKHNLIDNIQYCLKPFIQPTYQKFVNEKLLIHQEYYKNILDSITSEKEKLLMKLLISSIKNYFIEINNMHDVDTNLKQDIIKKLKNKFDIIFQIKNDKIENINTFINDMKELMEFEDEYINILIPNPDIKGGKKIKSTGKKTKLTNKHIKKHNKTKKKISYL